MLASAIYQLDLTAGAVPGHRFARGAGLWRLDALMPVQILKRAFSLHSYRNFVPPCSLIAYDAGSIAGRVHLAVLRAVNGSHADVWVMRHQASQWIVDEIVLFGTTCMNSVLLIT